MAELTFMMNIGKEMARKLGSVGIGSAEELEGRKRELKEFSDFMKFN